jgi:uncharacterized membrane protein
MTTMTEQRPARGRPRPAETIERDATILRLLRENPDGLLRNDIAERMGLNKSRTYLSLDRLRRQGLAEKVSPEGSNADKDTLWVATGEG